MDVFFQINLSTYDHNNILLQIDRCSKIKDVKDLLRNKLKLSQDRQIRLSIMGMGKVLQDQLMLTDYNLHNGSIVTVIIPVRGNENDTTDKENTQQTQNMTDNNTNNQSPQTTDNIAKKQCTFYDNIEFFPTQSRDRKIPKYYNYKKVITIVDYWCKSVGIKAIETELLDFIAIYTSYIHSKILCIAEDELRSCYFQVYVQLRGFNEYFKDKDKDTKRLWLDQYIELKMAQATEKQKKRINTASYCKTVRLSNITPLKCDDIKQSEFGENKDEMFVLHTLMPSNLMQIYKVKGELTDIVCWVEFGFMKRQNVKVFGLRSNMFMFTYQGMNVDDNKDGLDMKILRNREVLIDIEIVKILKVGALYQALSKSEVIQQVQNRLKHRFWAQDLLIKQRISSLAEDGYCIAFGEQLLYLDGPQTQMRDNEEDF